MTRGEEIEAPLMHASLTASSQMLGPGVAGMHLVTFDFI